MASVGCGEAAPPAPEAPKPATDNRERTPGPTVESEIGGLDDVKVKHKFEQVSVSLSRCFSDGERNVAYMSGDIHFVIRIKKDGSARWAYVKDSTLGDRDTEACMLRVLKGTTWPQPQGGEGLAENTFTFDSGGEERPPIAWTPKQLGPAHDKVRKALAQCKQQAGTRSLTATLYIDTDGKAASVGVASGDEKGDDAAQCVIDSLKPLKYPSPGSYASKVSVSVE
jgi:hypothetical protein